MGRVSCNDRKSILISFVIIKLNKQIIFVQKLNCWVGEEGNNIKFQIYRDRLKGITYLSFSNKKLTY